MKRDFKKTILPFILSLCVFCVQAQSFEVSGKIIDKNGGAVNRAIVKLTQGNLVLFKFSDQSGNYKFDRLTLTFADSVHIEITHLSHENASLSFLPDVTKMGYHFSTTLQDRYKTLKAVEINPNIYEKGDTTFINANAFRKPTDENVSDLLRNIPGMRVMDNGLIVYQGKAVTDLTVEGAKFSNDYTQITNNLSAKQVDQVQVIKNYNEIAALRGFEEGGLAINLKLKQDQKLKLSSRTEAGVGITNRYLAKTSTLILQPVIKSLLLANVNNVGFNPYNEVPASRGLLENNKYDLHRIGNANALLFKEPAFTMQGSNNTDALPNINKSIFGTLSTIIPVSDRLSVSLNSGYYQDRFSRFKETAVDFYENDQSDYLDQFNEKHVPKKFKTGCEITYTDSVTYIKVGVSAYRARFKNLQSLLNFNSINSAVSSKNNLLSTGIYATRKLGSKIAADVLLQITSERIDQNLKVANGGNVVVWNKLINYREQKYKSKNKDKFGELNFYLKNTWINRAKVSFQEYNFSPNSLSSVETIDHVRIDSFEENNNWYRREYSISTESVWKWKKVSFTLNAGGLYAHVKKGADEKKQVFPIISLNTELKLNSNRSISFNLISNAYFDYLNLLTVPYFSNYRTIAHFTPNNFYRQSLSFNGLFSSSNRSKTRNLFLLYSTYFNQPLYLYQLENYSPGLFLSKIRSENIFYHQYNNLYFSYDKMIPRAGMGTKSNLSFSNYRNFQSRDSFNHAFNVRLQTAVKKSFNEWIGVEAGGVIRVNGLFSGEGINYFYYPNLIISSSRPKTINYSLSYRPIFSKSKTLNNSFHSLDARIFIQPADKKYSFEIRANNLLDNQYTQSASISPQFATTVREYVIPRFVLVKLNYSFL